MVLSTRGWHNAKYRCDFYDLDICLVCTRLGPQVLSQRPWKNCQMVMNFSHCWLQLDTNKWPCKEFNNHFHLLHQWGGYYTHGKVSKTGNKSKNENKNKTNKKTLLIRKLNLLKQTLYPLTIILFKNVSFYHTLLCECSEWDDNCNNLSILELTKRENKWQIFVILVSGPFRWRKEV